MDLPGYGYAAAPLRVRRQWEGMMSDYFRRRGSLRGVFVIVDARRGVGELDLRMLDVCAASEAPVHLLMNKCDRLKRGALMETLRDAEQLLAENGTVQEFSRIAVRGRGRSPRRARNLAGDVRKLRFRLRRQMQRKFGHPQATH